MNWHPFIQTTINERVQNRIDPDAVSIAVSKYPTTQLYQFLLNKNAYNS